MALGMSKADIAVSSTGIDTMIKQIKTETQAACDICSTKSKEYQKMITTIKQYWSGDDCNNFIADLDAAAKELYGIVGFVNTQLKTGLEKYESEFKSFQKSNYKSGTTKIR